MNLSVKNSNPYKSFALLILINEMHYTWNSFATFFSNPLKIIHNQFLVFSMCHTDEKFSFWICRAVTVNLQVLIPFPAMLKDFNRNLVTRTSIFFKLTFNNKFPIAIKHINCFVNHSQTVNSLIYAAYHILRKMRINFDTLN